MNVLAVYLAAPMSRLDRLEVFAQLVRLRFLIATMRPVQ